MRHLCGCIMAVVVLAGCDEAPSASNSAPTAQPIARSANAGPGARNTPADFAKSVVQSVCLDTRPDFSAAPQALARAGGFVQNTRTGTYFHQTYDMSVKVVPGRCSMVAGTSSDLDGLMQIRTLPGVRGGVPRSFGGRVYVSMFVGGG